MKSNKAEFGCKRQSSSLKIQTVNEHRWLRLSHYTVTCRDDLSAGRVGKAVPAHEERPLAHPFLGCFFGSFCSPGPLSLDASRKPSLCRPVCSGRGLQITTRFWNHRLAPTRRCRTRGCSPCTLCQRCGGKTAEAMQEGAFLTAPWWAPSKKRPPRFYGRGLRDPLTSPFIFPPAREKGPAVVFGSRSRILLPRTITESAHTSHRREVHESNCW